MRIAIRKLSKSVLLFSCPADTLSEFGSLHEVKTFCIMTTAEFGAKIWPVKLIQAPPLVALAAVCSRVVVLLLLIHWLLLLSHCFVGVACLVLFYCEVLSDVSSFARLLYFNRLLKKCDLCLFICSV